MATSAPETARSSPEVTTRAGASNPAAAGACETAGFRFTQLLRGVSCAEAKTVLAKYRALPVDGLHGNTNTRTVGRYTCQAPTAGMQAEFGTFVCYTGKPPKVAFIVR